MHKRFNQCFPKGKSIEDYSADDIMCFADKINNLPRKILNYRTLKELFVCVRNALYLGSFGKVYFAPNDKPHLRQNNKEA